MSTDMMQGGMLFVLIIIGVLAVMTFFSMVAAFKAIRQQQEATNRILSGKDSGPALHAVVQQTKEVNRLLANIDKRLEKLEALEKIQIANMSLRDDAPRGQQQLRR